MKMAHFQPKKIVSQGRKKGPNGIEQGSKKGPNGIETGSKKGPNGIEPASKKGPKTAEHTHPGHYRECPPRAGQSSMRISKSQSVQTTHDFTLHLCMTFN